MTGLSRARARLGMTAILATAFLPAPSGARAAMVTTLYSFCTLQQCTDGENPRAGLIIDGAGNLYGTTNSGGTNGDGTVFVLLPNPMRSQWKYRVLHSFCAAPRCSDGVEPQAGLILDENRSGTLYGTTSGGGAHDHGTVFELIPNGDKSQGLEKVLYSFCSQRGCSDGEAPVAGLLMDAAGKLYGTTDGGGSSARAGTVFQLAPDAGGWTYSVLYRFCARPGCDDGANPRAGLIIDEAGNLYGTTAAGGIGGKLNGHGTVFELTVNPVTRRWTERVLYSFCPQTSCADGAAPFAGLTTDRVGTLYGTTSIGGAHGRGTVFALKLNPTRTKWLEKVLYSFCPQTNCTDGATPLAGLTIDATGRLYGTTEFGGTGGTSSIDGTAFELTPSPPDNEMVVHSFCSAFGCADGATPLAGLIMDKEGNLYATALQGGRFNGGTVVEIVP
jgi:uncharacterized repeat protein (TIGR03803 family)